MAEVFEERGLSFQGELERVFHEVFGRLSFSLFSFVGGADFSRVDVAEADALTNPVVHAHVDEQLDGVAVDDSQYLCVVGVHTTIVGRAAAPLKEGYKITFEEERRKARRWVRAFLGNEQNVAVTETATQLLCRAFSCLSRLLYEVGVQNNAP